MISYYYPMTTKITLEGSATLYRIIPGNYRGSNYVMLDFGKFSRTVADEPKKVLQSLSPVFAIYSYRGVEFPFNDRKEKDRYNVNDLGLKIQLSEQNPDIELGELRAKIQLFSKKKEDNWEAWSDKQARECGWTSHGIANPLIRDSQLSSAELLDLYQYYVLRDHLSRSDLDSASEELKKSTKKLLARKISKSSSQLEKIRKIYRERIGMTEEHLEIAEVLGKEIKNEKDWIKFAYHSRTYIPLF